MSMDAKEEREKRELNMFKTCYSGNWMLKFHLDDEFTNRNGEESLQWVQM